MRHELIAESMYKTNQDRKYSRTGSDVYEQIRPQIKGRLTRGETIREDYRPGQASAKVRFTLTDDGNLFPEMLESSEDEDEKIRDTKIVQSSSSPSRNQSPAVKPRQSVRFRSDTKEPSSDEDDCFETDFQGTTFQNELSIHKKDERQNSSRSKDEVNRRSWLR